MSEIYKCINFIGLGKVGYRIMSLILVYMVFYFIIFWQNIVFLTK